VYEISSVKASRSNKYRVQIASWQCKIVNVAFVAFPFSALLMANGYYRA